MQKEFLVSLKISNPLPQKRSLPESCHLVTLTPHSQYPLTRSWGSQKAGLYALGLRSYVHLPVPTWPRPPI